MWRQWSGFEQPGTERRLCGEHGHLHGHFSRKFSEIVVVVLISLVTRSTGNFPRCKPDEGNRVFSRSEWSHVRSHVLTKNNSAIASPVFALDAIISVYGVYGHIAHLGAFRASRLSILRCGPSLSFFPNNQAQYAGELENKTDLVFKSGKQAQRGLRADQ